MTRLDTLPLSNSPEVNGVLFEAPIHTSNSIQRIKWAYSGVPFFNRDLYSLWNLYQTPLEGEFGSPCLQTLLNDRKNFIGRPLIVCFSPKSQGVVGGAWADSKLRAENFTPIHILLTRDYRSAASTLLNFFLSSLKSSGDRGVVCGWGRRTPEDNPTKFFLRNGFEVERNSFGGGGSAYFSFQP